MNVLRLAGPGNDERVIEQWKGLFAHLYWKSYRCIVHYVNGQRKKNTASKRARRKIFQIRGRLLTKINLRLARGLVIHKAIRRFQPSFAKEHEHVV